MPAESASFRQGVKLTRQTLPFQIVERLSELYVESYPNSTSDTFKLEHFEPMMADPLLSATSMEQEIYSPTDEHDTQFIDLLRLSCAYCVETIRAEKRSENNAAWIFASFAQYWLGVANGIRFVSGAGELAISDQQSKAAKARDEAQYGETREYALSLAKDYLDWTASSAASLISEKVLEHHQKIRPHFLLSESKIADWLRRSNLAFGKKRFRKGAE